MSAAPINAHASAERFRLPDEKPCDCAECVEIREARTGPRINVESVSAAGGEETDAGTASDLLPRAAASCPSWCGLPSWHGSPSEEVDDTVLRGHSVTVATWENGGRRAVVEIEAMAQAASETSPTETLSAPLINLYVEPSEGLDDLSADQARTLAAFVDTGLRMAADQLDEITKGAHK